MSRPRSGSASFAFDHVASGVILVNAAVLLWGLVDGADRELAERFEFVCLVFFAAELVVRFRRCRWRPGVFLRQPWVVFDVIVLTLALAPLPVNAGMLRLARLSRLARLIHLGRHTIDLGHHLSGLPFLRFLRANVVLPSRTD
jgi:voltage-gated sodium channel